MSDEVIWCPICERLHQAMGEPMAYTPDDRMPTEPMPTAWSDAFDRTDALRESTIIAGEGHATTLHIRRRSNPEILEYMASNIERDPQCYNDHQLIYLLRMVADKIRQES